MLMEQTTSIDHRTLSYAGEGERKIPKSSMRIRDERAESLPFFPPSIKKGCLGSAGEKLAASNHHERTY
mgnify:FL=1